MSSAHPLRIRNMTVLDLPFGMRLCRQAGWNQTMDDWLRLLDLEPDGCFLAELGGKEVGTTNTCLFESVAWISMVLVDASVRGLGIGTALMSHALAYLEKLGVRTVRLDATSLGQPIYERLGFVPEYLLARHEGTVQTSSVLDRRVKSVSKNRWQELATFDREISGSDRSQWLSRLFAEQSDDWRWVQRSGKLAGFLGDRPGTNARFIGPCLADAQAGPLLLEDALGRYMGRRVFIDIPLANSAASDFAAGHGLKVQRQFMRMRRGAALAERVECMWASSGPEKG